MAADLILHVLAQERPLTGVSPTQSDAGCRVLAAGAGTTQHAKIGHVSADAA